MHASAPSAWNRYAPAGPATAEAVAAVEPLFARHGLRVRLYPSCQARHAQHGFLSGDDATRLADLHAAFTPMILAALFILGLSIAMLRKQEQ